MSLVDDPFPGSKGVTFMVRLVASSERREVLLETFGYLVDRVRATVGCACCTLLEDVQEADVLEFFVEWRSYEEFILHVQSDLFRQVMIGMELAAEPPVVEIRTVSGMRGMDLLFEILREDDATSLPGETHDDEEGIRNES